MDISVFDFMKNVFIKIDSEAWDINRYIEQPHLYNSF